MEEKTLKEHLESTTKDELIKKMKIAGLKYTGLQKSALVDILKEFLLNEENIHEIWNALTPFDREYLEEFLKYDESPAYEKIKYLHEKYGVDKDNTKEPCERESKIRLLFERNTVSLQIKKLLKRYLSPIVIKYDVLEQLTQDEKRHFNIIGDSFSKDFSSIINLVKIVKLSLIKEGQFPSKSAITKMNNVLFNKDFVFKDLGEINKIHDIQDTNRIYGIYRLLVEADLLLEDDDTIGIYDKAEEFLTFSTEEKCKYIFKHYLKSKEIYELNRIVESDYKTSLKGNMSECRNIIVKHLKDCPIGKWIPVSQFIDYIKRIDKSFLINQVRSISYYSDKLKVYLEPWCGFEEVEGRFIEVVLQEYMSVLGIIDTTFYEKEGGCSDYDYLPFFKVEYFRITPLGACVLGMSEGYSYEEEVDEAGFTVDTDFNVRIAVKPSNQVHMQFFEQFAHREEYNQYCVYKISFSAIVSALDKGITIENIIEYLRSNSANELPQELLLVMHKWERDSKAVVIKNITVVQTDNFELMEELKKDYGIIAYKVSDLACAFEINPGTISKVKREIEKKEYYCKLIKS